MCLRTIHGVDFDERYREMEDFQTWSGLLFVFSLPKTVYELQS